jgi:hypothetical protein
MDVATRLDYFRKEHQDYLRFLDEWDMGLELTASEDENERLRGIEKPWGLQAELLLGDFFSELRFAAIYQIEQARTTGRRASEFARHHIQSEEKLLEEIEGKLAEEAEEKLLLRYTQPPD